MKGSSYANKINIQPLSSARELMIFGDEQKRLISKCILEQIDIPPQNMEHETISLKYIKSERAFEILNRFFIGANIEYKKHDAQGA